MRKAEKHNAGSTNTNGLCYRTCAHDALHHCLPPSSARHAGCECVTVRLVAVCFCGGFALTQLLERHCCTPQGLPPPIAPLLQRPDNVLCTAALAVATLALVGGWVCAAEYEVESKCWCAQCAQRDNVLGLDGNW